MVILKSNLYAVVTGDIVKSAEFKGYGESLDQILARFEQDYQDHLPLSADRYAGDRFQVLLNNCKGSLRASLYIFTKLASLKPSIPVRLSIGAGEIRKTPEKRVSTGEGEAFRLSGSNLEEMTRYQRIVFEGSSNLVEGNLNRILQGAMDLLSALLMKLSPTQAEAIWYKLKGLTQKEIAQRTNRRQQSVSDILIAGCWRNIEGFLEVFEEQLEDFADQTDI